MFGLCFRCFTLFLIIIIIHVIGILHSKGIKCFREGSEASDS